MKKDIYLHGMIKMCPTKIMHRWSKRQQIMDYYYITPNGV